MENFLKINNGGSSSSRVFLLSDAKEAIYFDKLKTLGYTARHSDFPHSEWYPEKFSDTPENYQKLILLHFLS